MPADRRRSFVRFWGTFMVLVQLTVLYRFFVAFDAELNRTPALPAGVLLERIEWLKPLPLRQPLLGLVIGCLALALVALLVVLWTYGLRACRRGTDD